MFFSSGKLNSTFRIPSESTMASLEWFWVDAEETVGGSGCSLAAWEAETGGSGPEKKPFPIQFLTTGESSSNTGSSDLESCLTTES